MCLVRHMRGTASELGLTWSFALVMRFGGCLEQRYFTYFEKRQKLGNFRGLEWVLVCVISN